MQPFCSPQGLAPSHGQALNTKIVAHTDHKFHGPVLLWGKMELCGTTVSHQTELLTQLDSRSLQVTPPTQKKSQQILRSLNTVADNVPVSSEEAILNTTEGDKGKTPLMTTLFSGLCRYVWRPGNKSPGCHVVQVGTPAVCRLFAMTRMVSNPHLLRKQCVMWSCRTLMSDVD